MKSPTLLLDSIQTGDFATLEKIYQHSPDIVNTQINNMTPLFHGILAQQVTSVTWMLQKGANPNAKNSAGDTCLHLAADESLFQIAKVLLNYGADSNHRNLQGESPLHNATIRGDWEMVSLLLQYGADPNSQTKDFLKTPVHFAVERQDFQCLRILRHHGGSLNSVDKDKVTPKHMAKELEILEKIELPEYSFQLYEKELNTIPEVRPSEEDASYNSPCLSKVHTDRGSSLEPELVWSPIEKKLVKFRITLDEPENESIQQSESELVAFLGPKNASFFLRSGIQSLQKLKEIQMSSGYLQLKDLQMMGVQTVGEAVEILIRLDQLAGVLPKAIVILPIYYQRGQRVYKLGCCSVRRGNQLIINSLQHWLEVIGLSEVIPIFIEQHYDLKLLFRQMHSRYVINHQFLIELGILDKSQREIVLNKLEIDCKVFIGNEIVVEANQELVSCSCDIM